MGEEEASASPGEWARVKAGPFGFRYTLRDHRGAVVRPARQTWPEWVREAPGVFWSLHWGVKLFLVLYSAITLELIWVAILGSRLALDGFRATSSFAWHVVVVVSLVLLLGAIKPVLFFWAIGWLYWKPAVAWQLLRKHRCPSCLYPVDPARALEDGGVTCPECGSRWAMRTGADKKPEAKWRFVPRDVKTWRWWSASRLIDDRGGVREYLEPGAKVGSEARRKIPRGGEVRLLLLVQAGCLAVLGGLIFLYDRLDHWIPAPQFRAGDDPGVTMMRFLARGIAGLPLLVLIAGSILWVIQVILPRTTARSRLACGLCGACGTETGADGEAGVRVCPRCGGAWRLQEEAAAGNSLGRL